MYYLNPTLLVYVKNIDGVGCFCLEVETKRDPILIKDGRLFFILNNLDEKFTKADFIKKYKKYFSKEELCELLDFLESNEIVSKKKQYSFSDKLWRSYNWREAFLYHFATRDYPFLNASREKYFGKDDERMKEYKKKDEVPDIYLQMKNVCKSVVLKNIFKDDNSPSDIVKKLNESNDIKGKLFFIFNFCFGEKTKKKFNIQGYFLRKVVPSGGARHPTEIFYISFDEKLLEKGVYHYNVKKNSLELYKKGNFYSKSRTATFDLFDKFDKKPKGLFVFVSQVERAMWRYRDDRSFRAILVDIGIVMMMFRKISELLGFETYSYQKFKDKDIIKILELDRFKQLPLYVSTII